jgi:ABC-type molybdate transport system ATPase subunit
MGNIIIKLNQKTKSAIAHALDNTIYRSIEHLKEEKTIKMHSRGNSIKAEYQMHLRNEIFFKIGRHCYCYKIESFEL